MSSSDYEPNYEEEEKRQKKALQDIMRSLKSGKSEDILTCICDELGLTRKMRGAQMEALLIHATEKRFEKKTMTRDIVLMSWGLLQGYDNHRMLQEPKDFQMALSERSEKFLKESSYISKKYRNGKYTSYEVAQKTIITKKTKDGKFERSALASIREALQKAGEYGINCIADYLYETNMAEYIKEVETQDYFELDYIPNHKLPILCNVRDGTPTKGSLAADAEQVADDDSINSGDEVDGHEPETFTDDEPTPMPPPDSPEDAEKSSEELSGQDSSLSFEEMYKSIEDSRNAFLDAPKGGDGFLVITALAVVSIIFVIGVIILVRHITETGDSDPPIGKISVLNPDGSEESECKISLDAGNDAIIAIQGIPGDADIEDVKIQFDPEDTDLITAKPLPVDRSTALQLLIRARGITNEEIENWENESQRTVAIVIIYKKCDTLCINVTVEPDSEEGSGMEVSGNGGED